MKITIYSAHKFEIPYLVKAEQAGYQLIFTENPLNQETVNLSKGSFAISIFSADDASKKVIEMLNEIGVKHIALRMAGYDNVDLKKCHELGIKVANVPQYSPFAIAEHSMTLILCLNRKIKLSQKLIEENNFQLDQLIGFDMKNKTIGIVGVGKIGATFAKIASGFGCKLLAFDVKQNESLKKEINIKYVSLNELCKNSDIISLHCPLNELTKHLFDKSKFAIMKDGVFIINTARGGVINTKDLLEAIENKKVAGAGLDVYEFEKDLFFKNHKQIDDNLFSALQAKPNVIITSHQAFLTKEALINISDTVFYNIGCWQQGLVCDNEI